MNGQRSVYVHGIHSCELVDDDPYRIRFTMWKPYFLTKEQAFADVLYIPQSIPGMRTADG
jgi:hypothetical protein